MRGPRSNCGSAAKAGVFEWFLPLEHGGQGWDDEAITRGYLQLAQSCLTTTFVITQRVGACKRIAGSTNVGLKERLLPDLVTGASFATVGISHLTTSRRHLGKPALTAEASGDGYMLSGYAPWVTGAEAAEHVVVGAVVTNAGEPTSDELLVAVATDHPTVTTPAPFEMVALSASKTGPVKLDGYHAAAEDVVAGPVEKVMQQGSGGTTGGPQTSTLAVGAASASLDLLAAEADRREDLRDAHAALSAEHAALEHDLLAAARGRAGLRQRGAAATGQQPRAPRQPGGAHRHEGHRLPVRRTRRTTLPRGAVLPRPGAARNRSSRRDSVNSRGSLVRVVRSGR